MGAEKLSEQLIELALKGEKTGLALVDNIIADALNEDRMASPAELAELQDNIARKSKKPRLMLILDLE